MRIPGLLAFIITFALLAQRSAQATILEYQLPAPELGNPFAAYVYGCDCTLAQYDSLTPPPGFNATLRAETAFSSALNNSLAPAGVAASFEVAGFTFNYLATALDATLIGFGIDGIQAIAHVKRSTVFTYDAGTVVHELKDTQDNDYILFTANINMLATTGIKIDELDAFGSYSAPVGWTYSSRILDQDLIVDSGDQATVYVTPNHSTWQLTTSVPAPSIVWLFGSALLLLVGVKQKKGISKCAQIILSLYVLLS